MIHDFHLSKIYKNYDIIDKHLTNQDLDSIQFNKCIYLYLIIYLIMENKRDSHRNLDPNMFYKYQNIWNMLKIVCSKKIPLNKYIFRITKSDHPINYTINNKWNYSLLFDNTINMQQDMLDIIDYSKLHSTLIYICIYLIIEFYFYQ
jgi:hypothetical protein